jgi:hypothetical protein
MTHSIMPMDQLHRSKWNVFCTVYRLLNMRDEVRRLLQWAANKGIDGPTKQRYEWLLEDHRLRIALFSRYDPTAARWAKIAQWLSQLVRTNPRYYPKGAARGYKRPIDNSRKARILKTYRK